MNCDFVEMICGDPVQIVIFCANHTDFLREKNSAAGHWVHHPINFCIYSATLIGQSQTRTAYGIHIICMIDTKYEHFVQDLLYIIPTK